MLKKIFSIFILLVWVVMLGFLIERIYFRPSSVIALDAVTEEGVSATDEWFGIYQQGKKVGYAHTQIKPEAETYHLVEESEMDILALGAVQRVKTNINSYTSKNFLLKYFDFDMQTEMTEMKIKGAVLGSKLVLDIDTGGKTRSQRIPLSSPPYLSPNIKPAILLMGLETGRQYRFPIFNPVTMSTEQTLINVESKEFLKIGDQEKTIYKLKETFQGMETTSWITQDGETIKEVSALGYMLLKESKDEAQKRDKDGPVVDIVTLTMIPSDPINESSKVSYVKAQLNGVDLSGFQLDGDRQSLKGNVIEVRRADAPSAYRLPYTGKEMSDYLLPNALIQSDDDKIIEMSKKVLSGEKDPREAAKKLNEWVYYAIRKKAVVSIPSALDVLNQREGDCKEHTALYTALARAAGLPTRMAAGVVYVNNGFYYHAWPEVWTGQWLAVDPTFNEFPADATHIRFVTGNLDRQSDIGWLVGKLSLKVLEYR
ncbi:MAG TPA: transglutaminase-like domain-containing protein [Nitrospirota bacterium]|nr:transglutaminase-like domain-containing protein [Nitrospirota bacterium]